MKVSILRFVSGLSAILSTGFVCSMLMGATMGDCEQVSVENRQFCADLTYCLEEEGVCFSSPYTCTTSNCPTGMCSAQTVIEKVKSGFCAQGSLGQSCTTCEKYYCATNRAWAYELAGQCQGQHCLFPVYRTLVCVPAS